MSTSFNIYKIPFTNSPQTFNVSLKGRLLTLSNTWNYISSTWSVDVLDGVTSEPVILAIPLITGIDLLKQYSYLALGGSIIAYTDGNSDAPPTYEDLGISSNVYFLVQQ